MESEVPGILTQAEAAATPGDVHRWRWELRALLLVAVATFVASFYNGLQMRRVVQIQSDQPPRRRVLMALDTTLNHPDREPLRLRIEVERGDGWTREHHAEVLHEELNAEIRAAQAKGYR